MVQGVISFVLVCIISVKAHADLQEAAPQPRINAVSSKCIEKANMTADELQSAIQDKDINRISACFFKCYLQHYGVIDGNTVNVPATLVFVNYYIPDISLIELLIVGAEVSVCAADYEESTLSDHHPDCARTKLLINCLAKRDILALTKPNSGTPGMPTEVETTGGGTGVGNGNSAINAFWLAFTQSL